MKLLLDTCTFLWIAQGSRELSDAAKALFRDPANEVFMSAVSSWEIAVKHSLGRLKLPQPPWACIPTWRDDHGIATLALGEEETLYEGRLPKLHQDPFDRMLICQSIVHELTILTPDLLIRQYPVRTVW